MSKRPPPDDDIQGIIDDLLAGAQGRTFANLAEAQRFLDAQVQAHNARPQPELGGLTPNDAYELLHGDWENSGPLRVNASLTPDEIGDPEFLHNATVLLASLRDEGPAKATAAGNLARDVVLRLLPRLRWPEDYVVDIKSVRKNINEGDVNRLMTLRYVLEFAKLVHRRKGFRISPAGSAALDDARRGELLALLFRTFFRVHDLRNIDGLDRDAGLQGQLAFTLWKIRSEATGWVKPARLVDVAWLESAKDALASDANEMSLHWREWIFLMRVIDPLVSFGLMESRKLPPRSRWDRPIEVRKTALYDRLLEFRFGRSPNVKNRW